MSLKQWEKKVLETPGAKDRVREIEDELRLAAGLTALREKAGLSQRELAERIGVSQPRIAAIERSRNVTIDVLEQYVEALGGHVEISVVQGRRRTSLLGRQESGRAAASKPSTKRKVGSPSETSRRSA
ncbi:MAG: helix-turn-helix domain-containing protein [Acidimicrobiia bacterium]|nr:helix-turn-helix domain-containing protein [Acidimicrobiia bacterium]